MRFFLLAFKKKRGQNAKIFFLLNFSIEIVRNNQNNIEYYNLYINYSMI